MEIIVRIRILLSRMVIEAINLVLISIDWVQGVGYNYDDDEVLDTQTGSGLTIYNDGDFKPVKSAHFTRPHRIYRIYLSDGKTLDVADDHKIKEYFGNFVKASDLSVGMKIESTTGFEVIKKIRRLRTSMRMMDVTVDSKDHSYYADYILVHNCVHPLTIVKVKDIKRGTRESIPIFEVYYRYKTKSFVDWVVLALFRMSYNIQRKVFTSKLF